MEGKETFKMINKGFYEGEYKKNGKGLLKTPDGSVYYGEFSNYLPHGYGVFKSIKGCLYKGPMKRGTPDGIGSVTMPNGSIFNGEINTGVGIMKNSDGIALRVNLI